MAIKQYGASGKTVSHAADIPLGARVYAGAPKTGNRPGANLEYFRVEFQQSNLIDAGEVERLRALFASIYGAQPARLNNVQFLSDNLADAFHDEMSVWANDTRVRTCDGETITFDRTDQGVSREPKPCEVGCKCKPVGYLFFVLPEFSAKAGRLLKFMLVTHSKGNLDNMRGALSLVSGSLLRLRGVPFVLTREERVMTTPDGMRKKTWGISLAPDNALTMRIAGNAMSEALALMAGDYDEAEYYEEPEQAPQLPAKTGLNVILKPAIYIAFEAGKVSAYRFKDTAGEYYEAYDFEAVKRAVPNLLSLEPGEAHKLPGKGFKATYDIDNRGRKALNVLTSIERL